MKCFVVFGCLLVVTSCGFLPNGKKKALNMRSEIPALPGVVDEASGSSSPSATPENELQPQLETCKAENSQVIPLRRSFSQLSYQEYVNTLNSLFGFDVKSLALTLQETRQPGSKFTSVAAETQAFSDLHIQRLYYSAEKIAEHLVANPGLLAAKAGCQLTGDAAKNCFKTTVDYFAPRILRRELAADEASKYYALADNKTSLEGAHAFFHALLSSPSFLFVMEFAQSTTGTRGLSLQEIKTRLGLLFYRSAAHPAMEGLVSVEPGQISSFIQAQLQIPEVKDSLLYALSEWMKLDKIPLLEKEDLAAGIVFDEAMKQALRGELESLLSDYMWNQESFAEVLRSPYSFVNDRVSDIYGVTISGTQLQKKDLPADRSGMLTTPGLMSLSSKAARTSIVNRGLYVLEVLGCQTIPSPPANVIVDIEVSDGNIADLEKAHSANPQCAGCHNRIDPVGSGLEGFDHVGLVRGSYANGDAVKSDGSYEGKEFKSAKELANVLVEGGHFANCARQKIVEFALRESRAAGSFCLHSQLVPDASKLSFSGFLAAFLVSDSFLQYRLEQ